jgi:glycosyltransferase involved in cell wall biosynthesis
VCVYPAPATTDSFFLRDTSPLKLFEYLAASRPVVCADLPPLHDVVDESVVRFCRSGDAEALAEGISDTLSHPEKASARIAKGRTIAALHSWEQRMRRILEGL